MGLFSRRRDDATTDSDESVLGRDLGDDALDDTEKRALIFTDSVQDAAHRAGFVNQRSHTMSLRSALRGALRAEMPIEEWAEAALDDAQASASARTAMPSHSRLRACAAVWVSVTRAMALKP